MKGIAYLLQKLIAAGTKKALARAEELLKKYDPVSWKIKDLKTKQIRGTLTDEELEIMEQWDYFQANKHVDEAGLLRELPRSRMNDWELFKRMEYDLEVNPAYSKPDYLDDILFTDMDKHIHGYAADLDLPQTKGSVFQRGMPLQKHKGQWGEWIPPRGVSKGVSPDSELWWGHDPVKSYMLYKRIKNKELAPALSDYERSKVLEKIKKRSALVLPEKTLHYRGGLVSLLGI